MIIVVPSSDRLTACTATLGPKFDLSNQVWSSISNQVQCDRLNQVQCALSNWPTFGNLASYTLNSSHSILHLPFFTLNPTPSILHSASFNFQPYSRVRSLTSKKPFLFDMNMCMCLQRNVNVSFLTHSRFKENICLTSKVWSMESRGHRVHRGLLKLSDIIIAIRIQTSYLGLVLAFQVSIAAIQPSDCYGS